MTILKGRREAAVDRGVSDAVVERRTAWAADPVFAHSGDGIDGVIGAAPGRARRWNRRLRWGIG